MFQLQMSYEAPIRDTIRIRYNTDTPIRENFKKSISDTGAIRYLKINFKIKYINAQYINMTKINNINNDNCFLKDKKLLLLL
jgi:hypothetical protein